MLCQLWERLGRNHTWFLNPWSCNTALDWAPYKFWNLSYNMKLSTKLYLSCWIAEPPNYDFCSSINIFEAFHWSRWNMELKTISKSGPTTVYSRIYPISKQPDYIPFGSIDTQPVSISSWVYKYILLITSHLEVIPFTVFIVNNPLDKKTLIENIRYKECCLMWTLFAGGRR